MNAYIAIALFLVFFDTTKLVADAPIKVKESKEATIDCTVLDFPPKLPSSQITEPLTSELTKRGIHNIVFFASWCSSCREHLQSADPKTSAVVAAFDTQAAATGVIRALHIQAPCFVDVDGKVAKSLGISAFPAKASLTSGRLVVAP